jgi:hypothetical protein
MPKKKSTTQQPLEWATFDELCVEIQRRSRQFVVMALVDDPKEGGLETKLRFDGSEGNAILLLQHAEACCMAMYEARTFGQARIEDDSE